MAPAPNNTPTTPISPDGKRKITKYLHGAPLPPENHLEAWIRTKLPDEGDPAWVMKILDHVFVDDTVVIDTDVDTPTRSLLYSLFDLGIVRTRTYEEEVRGKKGAKWWFQHHHWYINFPGQQIRML